MMQSQEGFCDCVIYLSREIYDFIWFGSIDLPATRRTANTMAAGPEPTLWFQPSMCLLWCLWDASAVVLCCAVLWGGCVVLVCCCSVLCCTVLGRTRFGCVVFYGLGR